MKIVVSVAALATLGEGFRYRTPVYRRGPVSSSGVLKGDLIIVGRGDPNLSGRFHDGDTVFVFKKLAAQVRAKGIRRVEGGVLGDDSYFDAVRVNPAWPKDQLLRWYCAPVSALSINDNCYRLSVRGTAQGKPARIGIEPPNGFCTLSNKCVTGRKNTSGVWRKPGTDLLVVSGTVSGGPHFHEITVHNPSMLATTVFYEQLRKAGVQVVGKARMLKPGEKPPRASLSKAAEWTSDMPETLEAMNKRSQNFYAEMLLRTMGAVFYEKGTTANGHRALGCLMKHLEIGPEHYAFQDGCGLARGNKVSPRLITSVLYYAWGRPYRDTFRSSLPIGGVDGTLKNRFRQAGYRERVFAKTGYIRSVGALSGYLRTREGRWLAFSIIINGMPTNGQMKMLEDELCRYMIDNL